MISPPGRLVPSPRTKNPPPSLPPKAPTWLKRVMVTPGARRSAEAKSSGAISWSCRASITVEVVANGSDSATLASGVPTTSYAGRFTGGGTGLEDWPDAD